MLQPYRGVLPKVDPSVFIADSAVVIGDVELGPDASVWFGCVVRGDVNAIRIGRSTNVQDGTIIHANRDGQPTILGEDVTVGHGARLHGCRIASRCLVGIAAIVLDGVDVGEESVIAAGSVVPPGLTVPPRSVVMGAPARVRRQVGDRELALIRRSADSYVALKNEYRAAAGR